MSNRQLAFAIFLLVLMGGVSAFCIDNFSLPLWIPVLAGGLTGALARYIYDRLKQP